MHALLPGWRLLVGFLVFELLSQRQFSETAMGSHLQRMVPPPLGMSQSALTQSRVIFAEQQPGINLGAKIAAADSALGSGPGEIRVEISGEISLPVALSQDHNLLCAGIQSTISMSTASAMIVQHSNTRVSGCTFLSTQISPPSGAAEVLSQGSSDVQIENVTFIGGGNHIGYNTVSNFRIKNTRHVSITAKASSPILIDSSRHGQIISPRIESFVAPAGEKGIRLIGINRSSFVDVKDPVIQAVDASTVPGCGGVSFTASDRSTLEGGIITDLKNCDGVLTESTGMDASSDISISDTVSTGHNASPGAGKNANNGEGFDIFNSKHVRLSKVTARNNGTSTGSRQPGIEVSNSYDVALDSCISSENGVDGIKVDGSRGVTIRGSRTNHNGAVGILVMPALGRVTVSAGSPVVNWAPGSANMTFSAVWPDHTKIVIGKAVYTIASRQSTGQLTLTAPVSTASGVYGYNVDSYAEITGGESLDNGQLSAALPVSAHAGHREGVYFAGGFSGELTGRVSHLHASDTQKRKTQTFGIRVENHARIIASGNRVTGNLAGGIQDGPGRSTIH
jgi:hypothetical protein